MQRKLIRISKAAFRKGPRSHFRVNWAARMPLCSGQTMYLLSLLLEDCRLICIYFSHFLFMFLVPLSFLLLPLYDFRLAFFLFFSLFFSSFSCIHSSFSLVSTIVLFFYFSVIRIMINTAFAIIVSIIFVCIISFIFVLIVIIVVNVSFILIILMAAEIS